MSLYQGAKISTRGLVFAYDMPQPLTGSYPPYVRNKSWKGQPTTNIVPSAKTMASWGSYSAGNDGTFITEFSTTGYKIRNRNTWNGIYKSITLPSAGTYTISAWFRIWGKTSGNNGINVYTSGGGISDTAAGGDDSRIGEWQRISMTRTYTTTGITFYIISWGGTSGVDSSSWDVTMPQIEAGSVATPFVDGTRSNTQALLDWTGNHTLTVDNLQYNSDGTFEFNGTNSVITIPNHSSFNMTSGLSIEAWVNFDGNSTDFIFEKGNVNTQYSLFSHGSDIVFRTKHVGDASYNSLAPSKSSVGIINGTPVHIVGAWDGSTKRIYVNGNVQASTAKTGNLVTTTPGAAVGRFGGTSTGYYFDGKIYSVKVYNRALTADEVAQNFQAHRGRYGI